MSCGRMKVRGSLSLLQGISPTQGSNPGLPHRRWISHQLSHLGSPFEMPRIDKLIETERLGRDLDSRPSRGNCATSLVPIHSVRHSCPGLLYFPSLLPFPFFPPYSCLLPSLPPFFLCFKIFIFVYLFIWLHQALSCGKWDLVPRPGMEPSPLLWEPRILATGSPGKSPFLCF